MIWPRFFPLMEEDSLTEANVPYLDWLKAARGRQDELPWLVRQFQRLPGFPKETAEKEKAALYDSLEIMVRWDMSGSRASRTLSRKPVRDFYFHREPLIQRRQVSLAEEFAKPRLPIKVLSSREAEKTLDLVKEATGVRYRELYGTANADPAWVAQANPGRGVEIYFWGLPPEKRLPLRAYLAGFTVKNGVPINYVECISLFDWTEIGFNTFPAYRDGETAWIYAQTLRLLAAIAWRERDIGLSVSDWRRQRRSDCFRRVLVLSQDGIPFHGPCAGKAGPDRREEGASQRQISDLGGNAPPAEQSECGV